MANESGPFLQTAAFCEKVLQEQDGVVSLIRMVDRITTDPGLLDAGGFPSAHPLYVVVTFKGGEARGSAQLKLAPTAPSGMKLDEIETSVLFEGGEDRGIQLIVPVALPLNQSGVYWFSVLLDDEFVTKIPLRVVHQRQRLGAPAPPL